MTIKELKHHLLEGQLEKTFSFLYGPEEIPRQTKRYLEAIDQFMDCYEVTEDTHIHIYSAPGRTEICGNHTDHQKGRVLAAAIQMDMIAITQASPEIITIKSQGYDPVSVDLGFLTAFPEEKNTSAALVRGIGAYFKDQGYHIGGFNAYVTSEVLKGSGLSSSAAYENLIGTILNYTYNDGTIDALDIARAGQYAENTYFGKPCGLMDQLSSASGSLIEIDFAKEAAMEKLDADFNEYGYTLYIVDTGGNHADLTEHYAAIPEEMKKIAACLGNTLLYEVDERQFYEKLPHLRMKCGDRAVLRAMHFFNENRHVLMAVQALKEKNMIQFLDTVNKSGHSSLSCLQNIYALSTPTEQGLCLALSMSEKILDGKGACRVHGGGFAGTIQAYVPTDLTPVYENTMTEIFGQNSCYPLRIRKAGAYQVV